MSAAEAIALQKKLALSVVTGGMPARIEHIAGVDLAFSKKESLGFCAILVFSFPELVAVDEVCGSGPVTFPYVPGLLTFREGPLFLETFKKLNVRPDLLVFDGQGIAHPRRLGIASHMGLWLDIPSIGCAKSRLYGTHDEPAKRRGSYCYLHDDDGNVIGAAVRTRDGVKPVYISPGYRVGVDESVSLMLQCAVKYRIPLPTRAADIRVGKYKCECSL